MSLAIDCAVMPTRSMISDLDACSKNSSGRPTSFNAVSTWAARMSWRTLVPMPPTLIPSSMVTTRRCSEAISITDLATGTTQRGSITVEPIPCAAKSSATCKPTEAIEPTVRIKTSLLADFSRTSTPSEVRFNASMLLPTFPFEKRTTVGASAIATAS